jgi:hypothetical protein
MTRCPSLLCSVLCPCLTLPQFNVRTSNQVQPWKMCLILSRLSGSIIPLAMMLLVLLCLDLPNLETVMAARFRTGTIVVPAFNAFKGQLNAQSVGSALSHYATSAQCQVIPSPLRVFSLSVSLSLTSLLVLPSCFTLISLLQPVLITESQRSLNLQILALSNPVNCFLSLNVNGDRQAGRLHIHLTRVVCGTSS